MLFSFIFIHRTPLLSPRLEKCFALMETNGNKYSRAARVACKPAHLRKSLDWGVEEWSGMGWGEYRYENLALSLDFSCLWELKRNSEVGYWQKICAE